jgi:hypothetical protein
MNESDRQHVGEVIREFAAVHRVTFNSLFAKGYWEHLKDMSLSDFDAAATKLSGTAIFMPKPAEFRKAVRIEWT